MMVTSSDPSSSTSLALRRPDPLMDDTQQQEYQAYSEKSSSYRGFSTSITHSFLSADEERLDACSIVCCGILQNDRDRYLLTGTRPPTCYRRVVTHVIVPVSLLVVACYASVSIPDVVANQVICSFLIILLVGGMIFQCCKGRWKRTKVRKELLWKKYHMAQGDYQHRMLIDMEEERDDVSIDDSTYLQGQSKWDLTCAHALIGCYTTDINYRQRIENEERPHLTRPNNLCGCLWQYLMMACCGKCCGCHLMVCGMCGLAQEAREIERMIQLPQMDYITFQPVLEYAPSLWQNRLQQGATWWKQVTTLSDLSKYTLRNGVLALLVFALVWSGRRLWENIVVIALTLAYAVTCLWLVHWPYHKSDVSIDALIKYFASGFVLSTTLAVTWELVLALVLRCVMAVVFALSGVDVAYDQDGYQGMIGFASAKIDYHNYLKEWGEEHPFAHIIYLLINTYVVAALVEEICKYFGYRLVDHVDVWSNAQLEKAIALGVPDGFAEEQEEDRRSQGPLFSYQQPSLDGDAAQESTNNVEGADDQLSASVQASVLSEQQVSKRHGVARDPPSVQSAPPAITGNKNAIPVVEGTEVVSSQPTEAPKRTLQSIGAATTVSMVAVALGFACCENIAYILIYNHQNGLSAKLSILLLRAVMPVHPICAAIQSIGVCKRDLEQESTHQLGRIIFPAILLHGTFDFVLWVLDFMAGDNYNATWFIIGIAWGEFLLMAGIVYYVKESVPQQKRLERLDHEQAVDQSNLL